MVDKSLQYEIQNYRNANLGLDLTTCNFCVTF